MFPVSSSGSGPGGDGRWRLPTRTAVGGSALLLLALVVLLASWNTVQQIHTGPVAPSHWPPLPSGSGSDSAVSSSSPSPSPSSSHVDAIPVGDRFPTYTRNVTLVLEWLGHHDVSPLHHRSRDGSSGILVTFVNMGFLDMTLNWLCHVRALSLHSYLIIAMDVDSWSAIVAWDPNVHVYLWTPDINLMDPSTLTPDRPAPTSAASAAAATAPTTAPASGLEYNAPSFVDMMLRRLRFTTDMLRLWPHPLVFVDTDIVLLHDILPEFTSSPAVAAGDVVAQKDADDVMCAGQIWYRSTSRVFSLLEDVLSATTAKQYPNEQDALNGLLTRGDSPYAQGHDKHVNRVFLNLDTFPSGLHMWGRLGQTGSVPATLARVSNQGWLPASVHNNWILTKAAKVRRFQEYGMWQVADAGAGTCLFDGYYSIRMPPRPRVTIHILAAPVLRHERMARLLQSLSAAEYDSSSSSPHIDVVCHVDAPADPTDVEGIRRAVSVAAEFRDSWAHKWTRGKTELRQRSSHAGRNTLVYELWDPPSSNDEVILLLHDDVVLSPYWYTWIRAALDKYYGTDPFMFGISLQRQGFVPGPAGTGPNIPTSPRDLYPQYRADHPNTPLLYQQLGARGQLLFPAAWRLFLQYAEAHRAHAHQHHGGNAVHMDPSIGNLLTNARFQAQKNKLTNQGHLHFDTIHWEYWFMAMTCEYGLYTLYSDFSNSRALLVTAPGEDSGAPEPEPEHEPEHEHEPSVPLPTPLPLSLMNRAHWDPSPSAHMNLPPLTAEPVYDFWMKPVLSRPQLALRRMALHKYWKQPHTNIAPSIPTFT